METPLDYRRLKRYDTLKVGEEMKIILYLNKSEKNGVRYYAHANQMSDILKSCNIEIEHGGLHEMENKFKIMYVIVTTVLFQFFCNFFSLYFTTCLKRTG